MISTEQLRRFPVFAQADHESIRQLALVTDEVTFAAGSHLFDDRELARTLYLVTAGELDIQYKLNTGDRVTVDTLIAGDLVAWSAVVPPHRYTATGAARTEVKALAVPGSRLRELMEADHSLGYSVMLEIARVTSQRLGAAHVQLATR